MLYQRKYACGVMVFHRNLGARGVLHGTVVRLYCASKELRVDEWVNGHRIAPFNRSFSNCKS